MTIEDISNDDYLLVDQYVSGELNRAGMELLKTRLVTDTELRDFFVRYCSLDTDLRLNSRSKMVTDSVIESINSDQPFETINQELIGSRSFDSKEDLELQAATLSKPAAYRVWQVTAVVASIVAMVAAFAFWREQKNDRNIAWVVDAQNCRWVHRSAIEGPISNGSVIEIHSGLLELGFASEANIVVQGPAKLDVISGSKIKLHRGRVSVSMPKGMSGFEVLSPRGKVIDLGTEFGVAVGTGGQTDVVVFDGEVQLVSADNKKTDKLVQNQHARIDESGFKISSNKTEMANFVRAIVPPPVLVSRTYRLEFNKEDHQSEMFQEGVKDSTGTATGLPVRLSGTGDENGTNDQQLFLDDATGALNITATKNDINSQVNLVNGDYIGIKLSTLGFSGSEDFEVSTRILNIPELKDFGQFGLYIGTRSDQCIRGGMIKWRGNSVKHNLFLVNNSGGKDRDGNKIGYIYAGSNIELTFRRIKNRYSLRVTNLDDETSNTLEIRHPEFLDGQTDLQVGLFAANPFSSKHETIAVDQFSVTVWNEQTTD